MKVSELREIIKKYNEEDKEKIIVELYKRITKRTKEDYNIDNYIMNLNVKVEKSDKEFTIERLENEVNYFVECANSDLYASPNKIISKSERSKWRFKVKNFYKKLNSFLPTTEDGKKATDLLKDLFIILSFGTHYLTFSSWNTFGAIQISQSEFLMNIVQRKLANGITDDNLSYCIELLNVKYDPQEYHKSILISFIGSFAGMVIGIGLSQGVGRFVLGYSVPFSVWPVVVSVGVAVFVGLASGVVPARKAAKLNPIDSLRYE